MKWCCLQRIINLVKYAGRLEGRAQDLQAIFSLKLCHASAGTMLLYLRLSDPTHTVFGMAYIQKCGGGPPFRSFFVYNSCRIQILLFVFVNFAKSARLILYDDCIAVVCCLCCILAVTILWEMSWRSSEKAAISLFLKRFGESRSGIKVRRVWILLNFQIKIKYPGIIIACYRWYFVEARCNFSYLCVVILSVSCMAVLLVICSVTSCLNPG